MTQNYVVILILLMSNRLLYYYVSLNVGNARSYNNIKEKKTFVRQRKYLKEPILFKQFQNIVRYLWSKKKPKIFGKKETK